MARTHIDTLIHTYICAAPANVKPPLDARETEIYQQAEGWYGDETNAMEHEGRHEAKFPKAALTKPLLLVILRIILRKSRYFPQNRGASYNRSPNTVQWKRLCLNGTFEWRAWNISSWILRKERKLCEENMRWKEKDFKWACIKNKRLWNYRLIIFYKY